MSVFRFFLTLFVLSLLSLTTEAQNDPTYVYHVCSNTTTFIRNSTYQTNLNGLLSAFSNATVIKGFYNTTSGENPNRIYGLFLCRGDVSTTTCRTCVRFATGDVIQRCPVEKDVVIWYDECLLRYSNESIFATVSQTPTVYLTNTQNYTDPIQLNEVQTKATAAAIDAAAAQALSVPRRFATKEAYVSGLEPVYSLAQCTPDLSDNDCDRCLQVARAQLPLCCSGRRGGRVLNPSCFVRYEVYPFYNGSSASPPTVATPPPDSVTNPNGGKPKWIPVAASLSAVLGLALLSSLAFVIWRMRNSREDKENSQEVQLLDLRGGNYANEYSIEDFHGKRVGGSQEFPSIPLDIINAATKHFCDENKLGEGGFGPVYKGTLMDGKEIAVKRLSGTSGQGLPEFKNEVMLIARLQHRNLVRLMGCCMEDNETLLVYEYMPNRSLDVFLFGLILELGNFYFIHSKGSNICYQLIFLYFWLFLDSSVSMQLNWQRRFSIIIGIARGIMYLHEDSRLKIIHRDLKASNILLDGEMNPKISDFGMARIFGGNQSEANTTRVVGTYGYMAPEYAMEGLFSVKSDIFSFGVLLLEIVSGKKNNRFYFYERNESLLTFAWKLWSQGQGMQLINPQMGQSCVESEVLKCIHIGLLCVQKDPMDRPTMSSVIVMLGSEAITLPKPTEPAFFVGRVAVEPDLPSTNNIVCSVNEVTLSNMSPR